MLVKGAVPGPKGGILKIKDSLKAKNNPIPPISAKQEVSSKINDVNEIQSNENNKESETSKLQVSKGVSDNGKIN